MTSAKTKYWAFTWTTNANQKKLTDIVISLAGKKLESIGRRVKFLKQDSVFLLLGRLIAADESFSLGRIAVSKNIDLKIEQIIKLKLRKKLKIFDPWQINRENRA